MLADNSDAPFRHSNGESGPDATHPCQAAIQRLLDEPFRNGSALTRFVMSSRPRHGNPPGPLRRDACRGPGARRQRPGCLDHARRERCGCQRKGRSSLSGEASEGAAGIRCPHMQLPYDWVQALLDGAFSIRANRRMQAASTVPARQPEKPGHGVFRKFLEFQLRRHSAVGVQAARDGGAHRFEAQPGPVSITWVDTAAGLRAAAAAVVGAPAVAVDVEHNHTRSYLGTVCLLQLSDGVRGERCCPHHQLRNIFPPGRKIHWPAAILPCWMTPDGAPRKSHRRCILQSQT